MQRGYTYEFYWYPRRGTEEDTRRIEWIRRHWRIPQGWNVEPVELVERCSYVPGSYIGYRVCDEQGQTIYYGVLRPVMG